jgi:hypothetical protein
VFAAFVERFFDSIGQLRCSGALEFDGKAPI